MSLKLNIFCLILALSVVISVQRTYDVTFAREMLRASSTAYCQMAHLFNMQCGDPCNNLKGYQFLNQYTFRITPNEPVSYTLLVNPTASRFIVSFRGTETTTQLLKEFVNSRASAYDIHYIPNSVVIKYFDKKYVIYIRPTLLRYMREYTQKYPNYDYFFVGHSLGGAFATHASLDISLSHIVDKNRIHLYTYGCPRVGDYNFASKVVSNVGEIYRMTHHRDPVPHLPPCVPNGSGGCASWTNHVNEQGLPVFNAYHVWPEVFNVDDNAYNYKVCYTPEDPTCANQFYVAISVDNHLNYLGISTRCMLDGRIDK